jgi:restriction endonuclease
MGAYSVEKIHELVAQSRDQSRSTTARGRAFEQLFCYLLLEIPGVQVETDTINLFQSDEVDISVANPGGTNGLACFPTLFLVECKNWKDKVDSKSIGAFVDKLRDRNINLGILVAASGVTGNPESLKAAHYKAASAQISGYRIVLVTFDDIVGLRTSREFAGLLVKRLLGLIASGTFQLA